jgi:NADP-dependent 3-hydroxy acid dehydrogenase YdfG
VLQKRVFGKSGPEVSAIPAGSFIRMAAFAMSQPDEVDVNEIPFRPTAQEL